MKKGQKEIAHQGIDGCTFIVQTNWVYTPLVNEVLLKNPHGNVFGTLKQIGIEYVLFVCPPRYVRETNEIPFGLDDLPYLDEMRKEIERVLKKQFPKGYTIKMTKVEVNTTGTMVGNCECDNIFNLFCNAMLHNKDQNILYVTQSKENIIDREIPGFVSRTVGNQWKLKCYNKSKQIEVEFGITRENPLVRIEFILMTRKIEKLFGKRQKLSNVFSQAGVMLLLNEYDSLMNNLIDNYVKRYLTSVHKQLLADLREFESPTDVYCLRKQNIHDKVQLKRALKSWYRERNMNDNSNQVLQGLNKKFGLPSHTLETVKKFHFLHKE